MNKIATIAISFLFACVFIGCQAASTPDEIQREQQKKIQAEGTAQTGMPAIKNFRERKLLKDIIELRDQEGLTTYTYLVSEQTGKIGQLLCTSIGYGIPAATQYTSPERPAEAFETPEQGNVTLPQADPNGLFSPSSAEGTWVMCLDDKKGGAVPVYVEPRVIVTPFEIR